MSLFIRRIVLDIKPVRADDCGALLEIYAPYVTDTAITFEYEVPSHDEFEERIEKIAAVYPYIKAVGEDGTILGYAYASRFKDRKAYDRAVETTVYVRQDCRRKGIGRALYIALERSLRDMRILNMNACISVPSTDDAYLTKDSVYFHENMGFDLVGRFHNVGYKFNRWYDVIWMEKMIGVHTDSQPDVKFGEWKI